MVSEADPLILLDPAIPINHDSESPLTNAMTHPHTTTTTSELDDNKWQRARYWIYVSHGSSQFTEAAWQFALILFLAALTNYQSLFLVSMYGLVAHLSVFTTGSTVGRFVDETSNRLTIARLFLGGQFICVVLATLCAYGALWQRQYRESNERYQHSTLLLLVGLHIFGPLAQILDRGFLVAMERDWVVCLAHSLPRRVHVSLQEDAKDATRMNCNNDDDNDDNDGNDEIRENAQQSYTTLEQSEWLSETNVGLKQMDLSCRIVAPAVAGWVIGWFSSFASSSSSSSHSDMSSSSSSSNTDSTDQGLTQAALWVGAVNAASIAVEYYCSARVYHLIPALQKPKPVTTIQQNKGNPQQLQPPQPQSPQKQPQPQQPRQQQQRCDFWSDYFAQRPICFGGLGLALLYLNALTFGALMTAYLVWKGMPLERVGMWRGISSGVGLLGTVAYRLSVERTSLVTTGLWSIVYEFLCLTLCLTSFFVANYQISVTLLVSGVLLSRIGLWVFDISITQMMQETIPSHVRGVVGGTQQSLNALFQLASFALGLVFPDPADFVIYAAAGYIAVGAAMILYVWGMMDGLTTLVVTSIGGEGVGVFKKSNFSNTNSENKSIKSTR